MKVRLVNEQGCVTTTTHVKRGQLAIITEGIYKSNIVTRILRDILISLTTADSWEPSEGNGIPCRILNKGEQVILEQD